MNHLIVGDCFIGMIKTTPREDAEDVLMMNLSRVVMDQKAARRRVEFGRSDAVTHFHEGLADLIVDGAVFEQGIFYPQSSWHIMNIRFHGETSFEKGIF